MEPNEDNRSLELANEIYSFKELVTIISDYYCFKNSINLEEEGEGDEWKKLKNDPKEIIPDNLHLLIEKAFKKQLNKFT